MAVLQKKPYLVSIIILNYKTDDLTLALLQALGTSMAIEILVIDHNDDMKFQERVREKFPDVKYHFPGQNMGFAGGNNYGINQAKGEWIFLLNSDTVTTVDDILKLVEITKMNNMLAAAPKLIGTDGHAQNTVGYFDNFKTHLINYIFARPRFLNCDDVTKQVKVDICTGAAILLHYSIFQKIGILDDAHFFMYFEDIDFCYRLHQKHIQILYIPEIQIIHYGGSSSDKDKVQKNTNYTRGLVQYIIKHRGRIVNLINQQMKLFK